MVPDKFKDYPWQDADWSLIPYHMWEGVYDYVMDGVPCGSFLAALLSNDPWMDVLGRADDLNQRTLKGWGIFIYNYMPNSSHGSRGAYEQWIADRGLNGQTREAKKHDEQRV